MNIQIYSKNFDLTDSFRQYLDEKFSALDKYQEHILNFKVELARDQHHNKGEVYTIDVHIQMPNRQAIMVRESHSDARAAVDVAQDKIARQIVKIKDRQVSKDRKQNRLIKSLKFWKRGD